MKLLCSSSLFLGPFERKIRRQKKKGIYPEGKINIYFMKKLVNRLSSTINLPFFILLALSLKWEIEICQCKRKTNAK